MNLDSLMLSIIIILFPILVNVLHDLYINNNDKDKNDLFLDMSLISSLYLFTVLDVDSVGFIVVVNTVLLLSFIKRRSFTSIVIILFILLNYNTNGVFNIYVTLFQYILIYVLYVILFKNKKYKLFINLFVIIKVIFVFIFCITNNYNNVLYTATLTSIIFMAFSYLIVYLVYISEDIVKLHITLKDLEKEERYRNSLFKITHEIKNPIAVCKSYLDMFDFNNPDHERYIPILKEEMKKILVLLQDFSNINDIKVVREILDINLLLEDVSRQLDTFVSIDNIEFITKISDDEFYIEGDYNRLNQVLTNIIKNAKEAKDSNKKSYVILKSEIKNNNFIITIEDNGIGISEENMEKILEPFFTTKENGTGLGIPLSCEIIKAHNGKIKFNSEEGVGTKVTITLPFKELEF